MEGIREIQNGSPRTVYREFNIGRVRIHLRFDDANVRLKLVFSFLFFFRIFMHRQLRSTSRQLLRRSDFECRTYGAHRPAASRYRTHRSFH